MIFEVEIGKKILILSAESKEEAEKMLSFYYKEKLSSIKETVLPEPFQFKAGVDAVNSLIKSKGTVLYFTSSHGMSGKVDLALLPVERV